jgi:hypothetical protein
MATGQWGESGSGVVYQANVFFQLGLSRCQLGFGFRNVIVTGDQSAALLAELHPWILTNFRPLLSPLDKLIGCEVVNVAAKTGVSHDYGNIGGTSDAQAASTQPSFMACTVSLKSGYRSRLGTGRFFLPVRHEGWVDGDQLSSTGNTILQGFVTAFGTTFITNGLLDGTRLANFHEALPERPRTGRNASALGPLPAVPATWYDVESVRLNTIPTSLRSRRAGVGS